MRFVVGVVIILLLLALAVYERETVAAVAFSAVLLFCLRPQYSPPVIHAGDATEAVGDGQVLTSDGDGTWTMEPRRVMFTNNTWSQSK